MDTPPPKLRTAPSAPQKRPREEITSEFKEDYKDGVKRKHMLNKSLEMTTNPDMAREITGNVPYSPNTKTAENHLKEEIERKRRLHSPTNRQPDFPQDGGDFENENFQDYDSQMNDYAQESKMDTSDDMKIDSVNEMNTFKPDYMDMDTSANMDMDTSANMDAHSDEMDTYSEEQLEREIENTAEKQVEEEKKEKPGFFDFLFKKKGGKSKTKKSKKMKKKSKTKKGKTKKTVLKAKKAKKVKRTKKVSKK